MTDELPDPAEERRMDPTEIRTIRRKIELLRAQQNDVNVEMAEAEQAQKNAASNKQAAKQAAGRAENGSTRQAEAFNLASSYEREEADAKKDAAKFRRRSNELAGQIARETARLPRGMK